MSDNEFYDYGFFDSDAYSNETRARLYRLLYFTRDLMYAKETPEFIISLIGAVLNIFHLMILTRKSMRSTSVNVLMIGIAFSDLFIMIFWIYEKCFSYTRWDNVCAAPNGYWRMIFEVSADAIKDAFRRVSAWLGVLMAVTRLLIIKNPLSPQSESLSRPSFSWKILSITTILSSLLAVAYFSVFDFAELPSWTPPEECTGFPENYTEKQYMVGVGSSGETYVVALCLQAYLCTEGILKIVPAILLPILAFLLIRELKKAATARRKIRTTHTTGAPQKDHTTKLVVLMTVSFVITEGPLGITFIATGYFAKDPGFGAIFIWLTSFLNIFVVLNATTHCLICMTMSSQYRKCVKDLFCRKSKPKTIAVASRPSVSSMTSVRNVVKRAA